MKEERFNPEKTRNAWNDHYYRDRSVQRFPDENLVRLLSGLERGPALDFGCGSGRHLNLLSELGFSPVYGMDWSSKSVEICRKLYPDCSVDLSPDTSLLSGEFNGTELYRFPYHDEMFNVVILWGVLHYNSPEAMNAILREVNRILKRDGVVLGTLRSSADTHFKKNPDINRADITFFRQSDAEELLEKNFSNVKLGHITRSAVGDLESIVAHWVFRGEKLI